MGRCRIGAVVATIVLLGLVATLASASAPTKSYISVVGLQPFSAETEYKSLAGYVRAETYRQTGVWLTGWQALCAVEAQGCKVSMSSRDRKRLRHNSS